MNAREAMEAIHEILYPEAEPDRPWSPDTLDAVGRVVLAWKGDEPKDVEGELAKIMDEYKQRKIDKLTAIKAVRNVAGLGLIEAKRYVEREDRPR